MPLSRITSPFMSATANVYSPSANTVAIKTAGTDRVTVTNSGSVGIATNNPGSVLATTLDVVHTGSNGIAVTRMNQGIGLNANYSDGNVHARITTSNPNISFATSGDNGRAWITPYGIALGSSVSGSSGTGIAFPASQNASSDANTLDDYEEGTWTSTIYYSTTLTSTTSTHTTTVTGYYTKVGKFVQCYFPFIERASTFGGTSVVLFSFTLPFTVAAVTNGGGSLTNCYNISGRYASTTFSTFLFAVQPQNGQNAVYLNSQTYNTAGGGYISFENSASNLQFSCNFFTAT